MFSFTALLFVFFQGVIVGYVIGMVCKAVKIRSGKADEAWLLRALEMCRWRKSMPGKDKSNA